jgi:uncharacterized protein YjdB
MFWAATSSAQVEAVSYYLKFNPDSCWYDAHIIINRGSATTTLDRTQFNAQMTLVVPTGDSLIITRSYAPYQNNQAGGNTSNPMPWTFTTGAFAPGAMPDKDFYSITPTLQPTSFYEDINSGDTIKLFSFTVESYDNCGTGIRWFENGSDPDASAAGMKNGDFSNGFTIGSIGQLYENNFQSQHPPRPLLVDPPFVSCSDGIFIDLDATTSTCQGPLTYVWTGPNYSGTTQDVTINPSATTDAGSYKVVVTDALGCMDSLTVIATNKPDAGPDYTVCAGVTQAITGSDPSDGTWAPQSGNPAGATMGSSVAGVANVVFSNAASGVYRFIYSTVSCSDTMQITVDPLPSVAISGSTSLCIGTTTSLSPNTGGTWVSNNTAVANVDASTGVVTPVAQGQANFTFTNSSTGCQNTTSNVIVNSPPSVASLRDTICVGATTTLSPNTTTGTWQGFNVGFATISGFTVTGVAAGTARFVYTENGTGCQSDTLRITVRPVPTVTSSPGAVCIQGTVQLSPSTGGTWSTSNGAVASVTNGGLARGLTAGSATFTFTDASTGCISNPTGTLTVNANPTVSLSASASCVGVVRTASSSPTGGSWVSNNTAVATINPSTGVITPIAQGQATFTFTLTATGCTRTTNSFIVNPPPAVSISRDTICVGNTATLSPNVGGTWTNLVSAVASLSGVTVTGVTAGMGRFRFTESSSGCQAFDTVIVQARPTISNGSAQICVGSTTNLTPTTGGTWASSNGSIATIANSGLVTGQAAGSATFTFTSTAGCSSLASSPVQVNNAPIVSLQGAPFLCQSATRQLSPSVGGTWSSSNTVVATVTSSGLVTATGAGAVNFTFTQTGSLCTATTGNLTVSLPPTITNAGAATICVGATTQLNASTAGTWFAVDPSIGTITNTGVVTGLAQGSARFTFTDGNGCTSTMLTVTVQDKVATSITGPLVICIGGTTSVSPTTGGSWASLNLAVASITPTGSITGIGAGTAEFQFTSAVGCPSDLVTSISVEPVPTVSAPARVCVGSTAQLTPATGGTWTSNSTSLATVSSSGLITGVSAGDVTFVFTTSPAGCPSNPTSAVRVNNKPVTNLTANNICIGRTTTIAPSTGGSWQTIPANSPYVTISNVGLITGVSAGTVNFAFTQTSTGCTSDASAPLTVIAGPTVNVPDALLCIAETTTLTTTPALTGGTWSSTNAAVASINASTGVVTAIAQGQARFIYTDASGCQSEQSAPIVVNPRPSVAIAGNPFICIGNTTTLSPSTGGTWVSSNTLVATVDASTGVVTGVSAGTATFTFTDATTGCSSNATLPVTVETTPTVSITGPTEVCINGTTTLAPNTGGTWVSNNPAVATVHPNTGVVTAVGPGTATFTFTSNNTGCPAAATNPITVVQCLNPDFNATFVDVIVPGDVSTNDFGNGSTYGPIPLLISSPAGSVPQLSLNGDGTYEFQANMVGVYKYLVPVCKAPQTSGCPTSDLWITVVDYKEPIRRPIAAVDIATIAFNTPVTLRTLENDDCEYVTGCNLDPASVAIVTNPSRGTVTNINSGTGDITYTPNTGFIGQDTLVYTVCVVGEPSNCAQAKQIITVSGPSASNSTSAADDFAVTAREVAVSGNVLTNDVDPESHPQSVTPQTVTKNGTLALLADGSYTFTPAVGFFGPVEFPYTACDNQSTAACADATLHILVVPDLAIKVRVYLEGALMNNSNSQASDGRPLMRDNLRVSPFTGQNYIPTADPYKTATTYVDVTSKFSHLAPGNRVDFASIPSPSTVFAVSGQDAIVDWVFVQLRSKTNGAVFATRSGLLQRDGDVVDLNGIEPLRFPGIPMDDYYVSVRHHRHLGVMSGAAQTPVQLTTLVNFTKSDLATYDFGVSGQANANPNIVRPSIATNGQNYTGLAQNTNRVKTGFSAMWGGDFDNNSKIKAENPNDDLNVLFFDVFGYPSNASGNVNYDFAYGYLPGDFDMNSKSKFDNPNDDKNMLFAQLVTYPLNVSLLSNFDFFLEQLP